MRASASTWTSWSPARRRPTASTSTRRSRTTSPPSRRRRAAARHDELVRQVREAGARVKLLSDGDVAGAVMAANDTPGVDLLLGVGGTPEGIITACAMLCLGGASQAKLWPKDDDERRRVLDAGHELDRVLFTSD